MKKKFHIGLSGVLYILLFILVLNTYTTSYATEPLYNQSRQDTFFGKYTMQNIVEELGVDEIYSGDALESLTYWANQFMTAFNTYSGDLTLQQLVIHKASNNDIQIYISNATIGNTYDFLYIETQPVYTSMYFTYFDKWVYSGQNISYPLTKSMAGYAYKVNASGWSKASSTVYQVSSFTDSTIYLTNSVTFVPTYAVEGYTQTYGFGQYFLNHTVDVEIAPTPTPVPTATPSASGDYSQQLDNIEYTLLGTKDEIHNMRVDINQGLEDIENKIPTSGEIKETQVKANEEYWGDSGDLSGDEQEALIQAGIGDIQEAISGEINQQESVQMIHDYEQRLYNIFMNPNDFRIYWNEVQYQNKKLIPSGEINFSQMERDIPTIGMIMTYVRVILNLILTINIIKSVWNLLMQFLGIHEAIEEYDETGAQEVLEKSNISLLGKGGG